MREARPTHRRDLLARVRAGSDAAYAVVVERYPGELGTSVAATKSLIVRARSTLAGVVAA